MLSISDMNQSKFQSLHQRALILTQTYLRTEADLIDVLQEIDRIRGYRELGLTSLYAYATQTLKLSESVSLSLIQVARKAAAVPELKEGLRDQSFTLSHARLIAPVITPANGQVWLNKARSLSRRALEKELVREFPKAIPMERASYVREDRLRLELAVSERLHQNLKRVQDILASHRRCAVSLEDTLEDLVEVYLEKKDPIRKANRSKEREARIPSSSTPQPAPGDVPAGLPGEKKVKTWRTIPASLRHALALRDQNRCQHRDLQGVQCSSERWLDFHHILEKSQGGADTEVNLTTLCRGHHQLKHSRNRGA